MSQDKNTISLERILGDDASNPPSNPDLYPTIHKVVEAVREGRRDDARRIRAELSHSRKQNIEVKPHREFAESSSTAD